jgi:hypothetical protein
MASTSSKEPKKSNDTVKVVLSKTIETINFVHDLVPSTLAQGVLSTVASICTTIRVGHATACSSPSLKLSALGVRIRFRTRMIFSMWLICVMNAVSAYGVPLPWKTMSVSVLPFCRLLRIYKGTTNPLVSHEF